MNYKHLIYTVHFKNSNARQKNNFVSEHLKT